MILQEKHKLATKIIIYNILHKHLLLRNGLSEYTKSIKKITDIKNPNKIKNLKKLKIRRLILQRLDKIIN